MNLIQAPVGNVGTCWFNVKGREDFMGSLASTNVNQRGGAIRSSDEITVMVVERRDCVNQPLLTVNR